MAQSALAQPDQRIEASIRGEISGQVAVGTYIVQIGSMHGGVIYSLPPDDRPRVRPRSVPIVLRPRPFLGLLNRDQEAASARTAILGAQPLEIYGPEGIGKTSLLRRLAYEVTTSSFPDGILCLPVHGRPLPDVLQSCYDAFYESTAPTKPNDAQLREALQEKRALFFLDDLDLTREEIGELLDVAPGCAFALASEERRLWGEGQAEALGGLPPDDALRLVERELGRALAPDEQSAAAMLCAALDYHPLHIIQATALIREEHRAFVGLALNLQTGPTTETLHAAALSGLSEAQRQVLNALAAIPDAALTMEHVTAVTGLPNAAAIASTLERRGLVREEQSQYRPAGALGAFLRRESDLIPWAERLITSLAAWAERRQRAPEQMRDYLDTLLAAFTWAGTAGRWREVLRLGRAIDGALVVAGRWGAWNQIVQQVLHAAQVLGDQVAEAWAMHQLGTRALCLGDNPLAHTSLARALELRELLHDQIGAAVTRHNMELLAAPPVASRPAKMRGLRQSAARLPLYAKLALGFALALTLGLGAWFLTSLASGEGATGFTPSSLVFADQEVGANGASPLTLTMRNGYSTPITVHTVTLAGVNSGDFRIARDGCTGQRLAADQTCTIQVAFAPIAVGEGSAALTVVSTAKDSPHTVPLRGTGIAISTVTPQMSPTPSATGSSTQVTGAPVIRIAPNSVAFGTYDLATPYQPALERTIKLANDGTGNLIVRSVTIDGRNADDFSVMSKNCTAQPITPGKSCNLVVSFSPKETGDRSAVVRITDNAAGNPHQVVLSGVGSKVVPPDITPNPVNFNSVTVGQSVSKTVTITNRSTNDLTIIGAALTGTNRGDFTISRNGCTDQSVPTGKSCPLVLTFAPTAIGSRSATLEITDNTADSSRNVQLNGQGVGVAGIFVPNIAGFRGYEPVSILIKSTGSAPLVISRVAIEGEGASVFNMDARDCIGKPLPANSPSGRCIIRVQVIDTFEGTASATLQLYDNAPGSPHGVLLEAQVLR